MYFFTECIFLENNMITGQIICYMDLLLSRTCGLCACFGKARIMLVWKVLVIETAQCVWPRLQMTHDNVSIPSIDKVSEESTHSAMAFLDISHTHDDSKQLYATIKLRPTTLSHTFFSPIHFNSCSHGRLTFE